MELMTTDLKVAKKFFGELFDWKLEEAKEADSIPCTMINVGNGADQGSRIIQPAKPAVHPHR
jgi:predicted enzyme related to lactoylglutathione lyase